MPESNTILLVEDSPDDVLLTRLAFQHAGISHRLVAVSDGEQAVQYLNCEGPYADRERFPIPRLILLDLEMPHMTGFEFLVWVRRESELRLLPVIAVSGSLYPPAGVGLVPGGTGDGEFHLRIFVQDGELQSKQ